MNYQLFHGDGLTFMDSLEPQSVDCIIDDLPYGTTSCVWDIKIPFDEIWKRVNRVMKPKGAIVLFARQPFTSLLTCSNIDKYRHKWVWDKKLSGSFQNAKYMPLQVDEDILVFGIESVNYYPQMRKGEMRFKGGHTGTAVVSGLNSFDRYLSDDYFPSNIITGFPNTDRANKLHSTEKPVGLLEYLIKTYTQPGETVLDFTMGSGSAGIACANTGRNFLGAELFPLSNKPIDPIENPDYFHIAQSQIEFAFNPMKLFEMSMK